MELNHDISPEELEAIESYLQNNLTPDEHAEFEAKISTNASLQMKVTELRLLMTGVGEAVLKEKLEEFHLKLPVEEQLPQIGRKASPFKTWLVAASLFIIAGVGGWLILNRKTGSEQLFANYFKPDSGLITAMSAGADDYAFEKAMIDYKKGDYSVAIRVWDSLQKQHPTSDTLNYFLGAAHLANGKAKAAIDYLNKVTVLPESFFKSDAFWYTGLALLKEGKKEDAINAISQSSHENKAALLKELKK